MQNVPGLVFALNINNLDKDSTRSQQRVNLIEKMDNRVLLHTGQPIRIRQNLFGGTQPQVERCYYSVMVNLMCLCQGRLFLGGRPFLAAAGTDTDVSSIHRGGESEAGVCHSAARNQCWSNVLYYCTVYPIGRLVQRRHL